MKNPTKKSIRYQLPTVILSTLLIMQTACMNHENYSGPELSVPAKDRDGSPKTDTSRSNDTSEESVIASMTQKLESPIQELTAKELKKLKESTPIAITTKVGQPTLLKESSMMKLEFNLENTMDRELDLQGAEVVYLLIENKRTKRKRLAPKREIFNGKLRLGIQLQEKGKKLVQVPAGFYDEKTWKRLLFLSKKGLLELSITLQAPRKTALGIAQTMNQRYSKEKYENAIKSKIKYLGATSFILARSSMNKIKIEKKRIEKI